MIINDTGADMNQNNRLQCTNASNKHYLFLLIPVQHLRCKDINVFADNQRNSKQAYLLHHNADSSPYTTSKNVSVNSCCGNAMDADGVGPAVDDMMLTSIQYLQNCNLFGVE